MLEKKSFYRKKNEPTTNYKAIFRIIIIAQLTSSKKKILPTERKIISTFTKDVQNRKNTKPDPLNLNFEEYFAARNEWK